MKFKIGFALLAVSFVMFALGGIERFASHRFAGVAWAQDASDADQGEDVSSEPSVAPPDLKGMWSGLIDDNTFGSSTFTIDITQKKSKLKGNWMISAGGSGTFVGKVKSDGVSLTFKFKQKHSKCKVAAEGTLTTATEIQGTYTSKKCGGASTGMFDLTLQ
jgi:hypothetical protein